MKHLFLLVFFTVSFNISFTNGQNKKFLYGIGTSSFTDFTNSPVFYFANQNLGPQQVFSYSYGTFSFQGSLILNELNKNNSISFNFAPALRVTYDAFGLLSSSLPITINYNSGLFSTFNSDANRGFTIGLGAIIQTTPLIANAVTRSYGYTPIVYAQGGLQVGYRYWSRRSQRPSEINLQLGYL